MINFEKLVNIENSQIGHTEEDVKVNVVVTWLRILGHDEMKFEHDKNDIFIFYPNYRILIETKKLGTKLDPYIQQVHKYSQEKRIFLAILTNGDEFLFFSPMWRKGNFIDTLLLSIKRKQLNDPPIKNIVFDILSYDSIKNGTAIKAIEERENVIEKTLSEIQNKKNELGSEVEEINKNIIDLRKQLEDYQKDFERKRQDLDSLEKNEKRKIFCYYEKDSRTSIIPQDISHRSPTSRMTWCDYCKLALKNLGGQARLKDIYLEIYRLREKNNERKIRNPDSAIRNTLETNSRGKGHDIFHLESKGSGIWKLKE